MTIFRTKAKSTSAAMSWALAIGVFITSQMANAQHANHSGQHSQLPKQEPPNLPSGALRPHDTQMQMGNSSTSMQHDQMPMQHDSMSRAQGPTIGRQYVQPKQLPPDPLQTSVTDHSQAIGAQLTLDVLLGIAEANNPTLRQAALQIEATMGKAIQAGLYPNPVFRYSAEQIGVDGTAGEFHGGILSQEIVRGGKLELSRAKFLQRVKVAEANAVAQQFRVCNDVRIHFYSALSWQNRLAIQHELVKTSEDAAVTAREAFSMGQANSAAVRRSNVMLQKSRLSMLQMENKLAQVKRTLSALVGVDVSGSEFVGQLECEIPATEFDSLLADLWATSPELMAARAKARSDQLTIQREIAEPISNITIEGGAGYNFERDQTVAVAGVSFPLNIYDRNQGTIRQARADMARQCAEIERIQQNLRQALAMEYERFVTSAQHVQQYQQVVLPDLKESYRLLLESYKENRTDWNEVLHAQSDYYASRLDYFDWLEKFRRSDVLIDGMLLHGGLMAADGTTPPGHIDAVAQPR